MHRWYKALMISLIVLGSIFIRESYTYGLEYYYLNYLIKNQLGSCY